MPIEFTVVPEKNYFIARWQGKVSDEEMNELYVKFYQGSEWHTGLNELVDLSAADMTLITAEGLKKIAGFVEQYFVKHGISSSKTAVYSPVDLPFGIARMYEAFSSQSPENVKVFRDLHETNEWLEEQ